MVEGIPQPPSFKKRQSAEPKWSFSPYQPSPPPQPEVHIACAIPKGERADWIVEKCSELGAHSISWIVCERSQDHRKDHSKRFSRWNKIAQEAARQSHNNWLPDFHGPLLLGDFVRQQTTKYLQLVLDTGIRFLSAQLKCDTRNPSFYASTRRRFHRGRASAVCGGRLASCKPRSVRSPTRDCCYRWIGDNSELKFIARNGES